MCQISRSADEFVDEATRGVSVPWGVSEFKVRGVRNVCF